MKHFRFSIRFRLLFSTKQRDQYNETIRYIFFFVLWVFLYTRDLEGISAHKITMAEGHGMALSHSKSVLGTGCQRELEHSVCLGWVCVRTRLLQTVGLLGNGGQNGW